MSDRLAVMSNGRIAQLGSPREVYEEPADAYVADFLGVSNLMEATACAHAGSRPAPCRLKIGEFELSAECGRVDATGDVKLAIRPERVQLKPYEESGPNRVPGMVGARRFPRIRLAGLRPAGAGRGPSGSRPQRRRTGRLPAGLGRQRLLATGRAAGSARGRCIGRRDPRGDIWRPTAGSCGRHGREPPHSPCLRGRSLASPSKLQWSRSALVSERLPAHDLGCGASRPRLACWRCAACACLA